MLYDLFSLVSPTSSFLAYLVIFATSLIEGPMTAILGGAGAANGTLAAAPVYMAVVLGNLAADFGWFTLGRCASVDKLTWLFEKLKIKPETVKSIREGVRTHAAKMVFLVKFTVGFPIPTLVAIGMNKVPISLWAHAWIGGELLKAAIYVAVGYFFSAMVQQASTVLQKAALVFTAVVVVGLLVFLRKKFLARGSER